MTEDPTESPDARLPARPQHGRGAIGQPDPRYDAWARTREDDGWNVPDSADAPRSATVLFVDRARSVISRNDSPDLPFERSLNPYRGCEHGCIYCYARPTHAYLGLSPGLDFETRIGWKPDAAALLAAELARPGYTCAPLALGTNTDPYQPAERRLRLTRQVLEVLQGTAHPVAIVTKSALIERDLDLLGAMARARLAQAMISITTLDGELARTLEPRAAAPARRLAAVRALAQAGVRVGVLVAPIIPALTDHELEAVLAAARDAGARSAGYTVLRLPHEVAPLFREWLTHHAPTKADHVLSLLHQMRGGRDNDPRFGTRMRGQGTLADLIAQRFRRACARLGLDPHYGIDLDCSLFRPPRADAQMVLF